jgi:cell division topological specificity factor
MHSFTRLINRKNSRSGGIAKNRLQQVLAHDRASLSPGKMDRLKDDLVYVISKYVDIDRDGVDLTLTSANRQSCLNAHIPVVGMSRK